MKLFKLLVGFILEEIFFRNTIKNCLFISTVYISNMRNKVKRHFQE